jgi:hypothetical protein
MRGNMEATVISLSPGRGTYQQEPSDASQGQTVRLWPRRISPNSDMHHLPYCNIRFPPSTDSQLIEALTPVAKIDGASLRLKVGGEVGESANLELDLIPLVKPHQRLAQRRLDIRPLIKWPLFAAEV